VFIAWLVSYPARCGAIALGGTSKQASLPLPAEGGDRQLRAAAAVFLLRALAINAQAVSGTSVVCLRRNGAENLHHRKAQISSTLAAAALVSRFIPSCARTASRSLKLPAFLRLWRLMAGARAANANLRLFERRWRVLLKPRRKNGVAWLFIRRAVSLAKIVRRAGVASAICAASIAALNSTAARSGNGAGWPLRQRSLLLSVMADGCRSSTPFVKAAAKKMLKL